MNPTEALKLVLYFLKAHKIAHQKARSYSLPRNGRDHAFVVIDGMKISDRQWQQLAQVAQKARFDIATHGESI